MEYFNEEQIKKLHDVCKKHCKFDRELFGYYERKNCSNSDISNFIIEDLDVVSGKADVIISLKSMAKVVIHMT